MSNLLENLDVFYGELTPARATVYARLEGLDGTAGLSLSGFVRGPRSFYSTTLQSTCRLEDAGPGPSLLAKSLVIDPCYWSPETPNIYDVTVELRKNGDLISNEVRQIGFKPLGISGRFFTWEGKPWVLRGVSNRSVSADVINDWNDRSTSIVFVSWPNQEELLQQLEGFSLHGVLAWIFVPAEQSSPLRHWVPRLSRFPSVAGLVLLAKNTTKIFTPDIFAAAPNLLIGDAVMGAKTPSDSRAVFCCRKPNRGESVYEFRPAGDRPIVAWQEMGLHTASWGRQSNTLEQARAACDKLQADLAPCGQFAGYIV